MVESDSPAATGDLPPERAPSPERSQETGHHGVAANVVPLRPSQRRPDEITPPDPLLRRLQGDVLRRTRHGRGLTLAELARRSGISLAYLSEIERGHKEASSEVLGDVCGALELGLDDLLLGCVEDLRAFRDLDRPRPGRRTAPPTRLSSTRLSTGTSTGPSTGPADVLLLAA